MNRIKRFAVEHPVAFGCVVTFVFVLMLIISAILGSIWPGKETYGQPGGLAGRLISTIILLGVLSRFGWLRSAGLTSLGRWGTWLIILLPLAYSIAVSAYALTGGSGFGNSDLALSGLVTLWLMGRKSESTDVNYWAWNSQSPI